MIIDMYDRDSLGDASTSKQLLTIQIDHVYTTVLLEQCQAYHKSQLSRVDKLVSPQHSV